MMKSIRSTAARVWERRRAFGTGAAISVLAACAASEGIPTGVADNGIAVASAALAGTPPPGLVTCAVQRADSVSKRIGPKGGVLRVGKHQVHFPKGALAAETMITAIVPASNIAMIDLQPHGLTFEAKPKGPTLRLSYRHCTVTPGVRRRVLYIADDRSVLEDVRGLDDQRGQTVRTSLRHFSNYAVAE